MTKLLCAAIAVLAACSDDAPTRGDFAAVIRGRLAASDAGQAKAMHDAAAAGQAAATRRGDIEHHALLGTTLLDSIEGEFLAIDRWTDRAAMAGFYAAPSPDFTALFAGPPSVEFFELQADWATWGDTRSGDAFDPSYIHFALGELAQTDEAANHAAHDMVASGGMAPSIQAGNVAHLVLLGLEDRRRFLGLDIWGSSTNIAAFYTNPMFVAAFAPLFTSVEQPVFQSTDWYQW